VGGQRAADGDVAGDGCAAGEAAKIDDRDALTDGQVGRPIGFVAQLFKYGAGERDDILRGEIFEAQQQNARIQREASFPLAPDQPEPL